MRIGITCYPTYGGSGIVATELGMELAARGHDVHFITYANPIRLDPGTQRIYYHEVEVSNYPLFQYPPYCLALASRMAEVADDYQLDLLHVHYAIPHSTAAMLAQQMMAARRRLPFITTLHGTDITIVGMDRSYFPITKFSIEKSDGITGVSEDVRRDTYRVFEVPNEIRVIYNFVNTDLYKPAERRDNDEMRLMHISNFRPVKRVNDCVRILAEVVKATPAHLYMVGDGPDRPEAHRLARELGLDRHVTFMGKQDHVERLFPRMHALLMPSEMESCGLGALEAMACGVPPVVTRVGGLPELVTDGVDGFLEPVGDIAAQSRRVIELLTNTSMHARMAEAARRTAVERFASSAIIPQYEKFYEEVVANGK
jgi:N-acetyl-alpha-D-glucosaminyl L-malate synthase BshA